MVVGISSLAMAFLAVGSKTTSIPRRAIARLGRFTQPVIEWRKHQRWI
jgi:hypothetical protein